MADEKDEPRIESTPLADYQWSDEASPNDLAEALEAGQPGRALVVTEALLRNLGESGRALPHGTAEKALDTLRKYTQFERMEAVSAAIRANEPDSLIAGRQYAQALIEAKKCTTAIRVLAELQERATADAAGLDLTVKKRAQKELPELQGLLGRAYKQLYVDAMPNAAEPRDHDRDKAIEYYHALYDRQPTHYWHGGNWIALLSHAAKIKQGTPKALSTEARKHAKELIEQLENESDHWAAATRMEAYLALGDTPNALKAAKKFLADPKTDRFAVNSTLRQLRELWCLTPDTPPGSLLIPIFEVRLAQHGGTITLEDPAEQTKQFYSHKTELQRVWGDTHYQPVDWLEDALTRTRSIARIGPSALVGDGTGFLIDGTALGPAFAGRALLLTNAHVCSSDVSVQQRTRALDPAAARAVFLGTKDARALTVKQLYSSPPHELDFTLLELEQAPPAGTVPLVPVVDTFPKVNDRVGVIGHPHGASMQVSIQDNRVTQIDDKYIWYRSPTDPGHSGSPVFDAEWRLVAIHHAARAQKLANEGVRIDRVLAALRTQGLSEKHESMSVVADGAASRSPWDAAHARAAEEGHYVEPDFRQSIPRPEVEHERKRRSPKGLNEFWPPTDVQYRFAWHLEHEFSQLRSARSALGDPGEARIRVGILDTGYDPGHASLPLHLNLKLARNVSGEGDPFDARDPNDSGWGHQPGHGTATLALLAGNRIEHADLPGGADFLGGAPFIEVVPIRVADSVVHLRTNALAEGIEHAVQIGCRVISVSMGGVPTRRWANAVNAAYERGVVIVAAAGNRFGPSPPATLVYPARFRRVIGVCGACYDRTPYFREGVHSELQGCFGPDSRMKAGVIAAFTANMPWALRGTPAEFANDGGGTSAATPQVAAAAALWLQKHIPVLPDTDPWRCVEAVRHALFSSAARPAGFERVFGSGLLQAADALAVAVSHDLTQSPPAKVSFPWLRLISGLERARASSEATPAEEMLEAEALQTYAASPKLQEMLGYADPEDDVDPSALAAMLGEMSKQGSISHQLRRKLERPAR